MQKLNVNTSYSNNQLNSLLTEQQIVASAVGTASTALSNPIYNTINTTTSSRYNNNSTQHQSNHRSDSCGPVFRSQLIERL